MSVKETLKQLESEKTKVLMAELYGAEKAEENRARYRYVAEPVSYTHLDVYKRQKWERETGTNRIFGSGRQKKMVCKRNLSCRMRFRVRNKSEKPAAARCAVSAMSSAGRWHFSA